MALLADFITGMKGLFADLEASETPATPVVPAVTPVVTPATPTLPYSGVAMVVVRWARLPNRNCVNSRACHV